MDSAPTVQSTIVESIDSIASKEVPRIANISMQKSSVIQLEQPCNYENQEISAQPVHPTSNETKAHESLPMDATSNESESSAHKPLPTMDATSSTLDVEKSILTIILDLNGLLLKRSSQPSSHYKSMQVDVRRYIILRPGCIQFLKTILQRFNVAIWSTAMRKNVLQILKALENLAGDALPFFATWYQEGCYTSQNPKLFRPDNPNVEAMFKPLAKFAMGFECDPQRTIFIDDSPYKGCISPSNNCIFPPNFDGEKMGDNMLLGELLPYLLQLDEIRDVRNFIASNRYGQPAVMNCTEYKEIIEYWRPKNDVWSATFFITRRFPPAKYDRGETILEGKLSQTSDTSHHSAMRRAQIQEILLRKHTPIENMRESQLISLARELGCSTKGPLKATTAKAYINRLKADHNLLTLDRKQL